MDLEPLAGAIRVAVPEEMQTDSSASASLRMNPSGFEGIEAADCIVQKASETVREADLQKKGSVFEAVIPDLDPGGDYSVLIYGRDAESEILSRGFESGIAVLAGQTTPVDIQWNGFTPDPLWPADGSAIRDRTPGFLWSSVPDASAYELQTAVTGDFSLPGISETLSDTAYTSPDPFPDGILYWRVRAKDGFDVWGGWTQTQCVEIDTQAPPAPALTAPPDGFQTTDNTPAFTWTPVSNAAGYSILVDEDPDFSTPSIHDSVRADPVCTLLRPLPDGSYYWKVRARDRAGNRGPWSESRRFTVVEPETVTDADGNVYPVVKIGDQLWMAEHLRVTRYRNGDAIPKAADPMEWANATAGAYCAFENDEGLAEAYGYLYNWHAVRDERGLAPDGWHIPTDEEWKVLETALGMSRSEADGIGYRGTDEGGKLKSTGTDIWYSPNVGATNETGFNAIPGGYRYDHDGTFYSDRHYATFWSSSAYYDAYAWYRYLTYDTAQIIRGYNTRAYGYSVRCIRD